MENTMTISAPKLPNDHPDRQVDCEQAMKDDFQHLAEQAESIGWTGDEIALALMSLAANRIMARAANENTQAQTERAKRALLKALK
jgi:hypothetical protein